MQKIYVLGEFAGRGIGHDLIDRVFTEAVVRAPVVWLVCKKISARSTFIAAMASR